MVSKCRCVCANSVYRSLFKLSVQVWRRLLYWHHLCLWWEATLSRPLRWRLLLKLWEHLLFSPFSWRNEVKTSAKSPRRCCLFAVRLVDSNRKSVTHPADLSSLRRPVAQTEQTEGESVLQTGSKKTIDRPQESSKPTTGQGSSQVETQVGQGIISWPSAKWHKWNTKKVALQCGDVIESLN